MMTVRFPNGQAVQYNSAGFVDRSTNYSDLYTKDPKTGGKWLAQIPHTCLIENVPACRVYQGIEENETALRRELRLMRKQMREIAKGLRKQAAE